MITTRRRSRMVMTTPPAYEQNELRNKMASMITVLEMF